MDIYSALSVPVRRDIITLLAREHTVPASRIYEVCDRVTPPAVSQHLGVLLQVNLVGVKKVGRQRMYTLKPDRLAEVGRWMDEIERMWDKRLDALDDVLAKIPR